jgi:hypothetical protein
MSLVRCPHGVSDCVDLKRGPEDLMGCCPSCPPHGGEALGRLSGGSPLVGGPWGVARGYRWRRSGSGSEQLADRKCHDHRPRILAGFVRDKAGRGEPTLGRPLPSGAVEPAPMRWRLRCIPPTMRRIRRVSAPGPFVASDCRLERRTASRQSRARTRLTFGAGPRKWITLASLVTAPASRA